MITIYLYQIMICQFSELQVMSIEGQVNALIQQARDPSNLAAVFVGWQPYI